MQRLNAGSCVKMSNSVSVLNSSSSLWRRLGDNFTQQTPRIAATVTKGLWRGLHHPLLALILVLLAALLALAANLLPQLPGQLRDEPATAARWLLSASSEQGMWGSFWLGLGLFDILHSPFIALLGILLSLALSAHLAAQLAAIAQVRAAARAWDKQAGPLGDPLPLPATTGLRRSRLAVPAPPAQTAQQVHEVLAQRFASVDALTLPRPGESSAEGAEGSAEADNPNPGDVREADAQTGAAQEQRYLATTGQLSLWLRLLLPLGLLLALAAVWSAIAFGWQVTTPPLAPGETFRAVNQNLVLAYQAPEPGQGEAAAALVVRVGEHSAAFSTARSQRARVGSTSVTIQPQYPGVLVQMDDGAAELARPGSTESVAQAGIVIPARGGEESVLLPGYGAGLRIVQRGAEHSAFILELYRSSDVEPVFRAELTPSGRVTIPLDDGAAAIVVTNMPGLKVDVRHAPGIWLAWVGLGIALVGLFAALRRAGFALVQLAPWPVSRTLVVIQSNLPREHARLVAHLSEITPGEGSEGNDGAPSSSRQTDA